MDDKKDTKKKLDSNDYKKQENSAKAGQVAAGALGLLAAIFIGKKIKDKKG